MGTPTLLLPTSLIALVALAVASPATAAPFWGIGKAIDGDSLTVDGREVRLHGIDAPEFNQSCQKGGQDWACGAEAYDRLSRLVTGKEVRCTEIGKDQYGRTLGRCSVGAMDVNRTMVTTGYAVAFRRYSSDYASAEDSAKLSKRGIWAGTFEMPWAYRHEAEPVLKQAGPSTGPLPQVVKPKPPRHTGGCNIKGNVSRRQGELIYHLPGMPYYAETVPERWFCSEKAALAAGFRKSRAE